MAIEGCPSAHEAQKEFSSLNGSNESPSVVSVKTDEGDVVIHPVKPLGVNLTQLFKDLDYKKNVTESERACLDSINGSNKSVEPPSVVSVTSKKTDEGDGAVTLNQINLEVNKAAQGGKNYSQLTKDLEYKKNDCELESVSVDKNDSESESDSEYNNDSESEEEHENTGPSWFYTGHFGKIIGPISINSLIELNEKGLLFPDTIVWKNGHRRHDAILLREMLSGKREMTDERDLVIDLSDDGETTHTHETQEHENAGRNWHYRDPYGTIQGPVPRNSLNRWCHGHFLSPVTTVWRVGQTPKNAILLRDMLLRTSIASGKRKRTDEGDEMLLGKRKRTDEGDEMLLGKSKKTDEGDGAAASNIIPRPLHSVIQVALQLRGKMMNGNCPVHFYSQMEQCEEHIETWVKRLKELKKLPHDWEYNPETASNLVPAKPDIPALPNMACRQVEPLRCCSSLEPGQEFPKTVNVPLDEEEKKIWELFKASDQNYAGHQYIDLCAVDEHKKPLPVDYPIVSLASKFAVTAFNEAIKMYVKKGEQNNIHDYDIVECKYLKMSRSNYYFYITIDAFEEGIRGIYDTKVRLNWKDGSKSLMQFVLTDRKPRDDNKTLNLKKPRTLPDSWQDVSCFPRSGMRPRRNREGICTGYDFLRPDGHVGP